MAWRFCAHDCGSVARFDVMDSTNVYHVLRLATLPWLGWRERGSVLHGLSALR